MSLIERTRYVWAALLGMIAGPAMTSLGIRGNMQINARTCLVGALMGVALAYSYELHFGLQTDKQLWIDVRRISRSLGRSLSATIRLLTPKRWWFRYSLRTWFAIVAAIGLTMSWIGHNLHRNLERDEVAVTILQTNIQRDFAWYKTLVTGPRLVPNVHVDDSISASDLRRVRNSFPEANVWAYYIPPPGSGLVPAKVWLLAGRSIYQERAGAYPDWDNDYSQ
jgi:hypothetical protein